MSGYEAYARKVIDCWPDLERLNLRSSGTREQVEALRKFLAEELPISLFWPVRLGEEHRWYLPIFYEIQGEGVTFHSDSHLRDYRAWEDSNVWLYQDALYFMDGRYGEEEERRGLVEDVKWRREHPGD
jgi:hypothetical protein